MSGIRSSSLTPGTRHLTPLEEPSLDSILQDLRYAVRTLAKAPGFTATAVLTLALGIGATTSIFSLVDAALLRPLPFPHAEQLVVLDGVQAPFRDAPSVRYMTLLDWRAQPGIFSHVAEYGSGGMNLGGDGHPERLRVAQVTPDFFATLGVMPLLGSPFSEEEGRPGSGDVVILSDGLWRRAFGSDPGILGRSVELNSRPHRVIGVMPPGFSFPARADIWIPLAIPWDQTHADIYRFFIDQAAIGRMLPGITPPAGSALVEDANRRFEATHPQANSRWRTHLIPLRAALTEDRASGYALLLATVGVVLLIACANVAGLSIARTVARDHDFALRAVLGASRGRLARQLLSETFVLATIGAALGVLASTWSYGGLVALLPDTLVGLTTPGLDWHVLWFTIVLVCAATALCGFSPLWGAERLDLVAPLHGGSWRSGRRGTTRLRRGLVTAQLALALSLVSGAGILLQSLIRMEKIDLGFRPDHVLTADLSLPTATYRSVARQRLFYDALQARMAGLPGVQGAGFATGLPLSWGFDLVDVRPAAAARPDVAPVAHGVATPGYFAAVGLPVLAGRDFTAADDSAGLPVLAISKSLADKLGLGVNAVGAVLRVGTPVDSAPRTVIAVVGDATLTSPTEEMLPAVYLPFGQQTAVSLGTTTLVIRSSQDPAVVTNLVRLALASVDASIPLYRIRTLHEIVEASFSVQRELTVSLVAFASAALALAALGLYGVLAYIATRRTREIGIRIALGARRFDVLRLVMREGLVTVVTGTALGVLLALGASRFLTHFSYGVSNTDPVSLIVSSVVLGVAALAAAWVPALKATRVDPVVALRTE